MSGKLIFKKVTELHNHFYPLFQITYFLREKKAFNQLNTCDSVSFEEILITGQKVSHFKTVSKLEGNYTLSSCILFLILNFCNQL